ncbi:MAG: hypothetical protein ACK47B_26180 [Armatimonadota bacterium]
MDLSDITTSLEPTVAWSTQQILPAGFLPMLPTAAPGPLDSADHAYEVKWDGIRVLAGYEGQRLVLRNVSGQDIQEWFPELEAMRGSVFPDWVLLDGELVLDADEPSIFPLQRRLMLRDPQEIREQAQETPAVFMVYDLLRIGDSWMLDVNWDERRDILTRVLRQSPQVRLSPAFETGAEALEVARELGRDSVVGKRTRGRYYPGEKTRDWLSIKPREIVEAVICGWTEGRGVRRGTIGTLILGVYSGDELIYIGHTGTGIDAETLQSLHRELIARGSRRCPLAEGPSLKSEVRWVRPELVCRIRHQGWSETGKMRGPTFLEMVTERSPSECRLSGLLSRSGC